MSHDSINHDIAANLRRGDTVAVRSLSEIRSTLDADAKLEGLPFMPEMVPCCGQTFKVYRRADKTCVEGVGIRSMSNTVFLEGLRCDGSLHDDCQRGCLFFWKEAWLKSAPDSPLTKGEGTSISGSPPPLGEGNGLNLRYNNLLDKYLRRIAKNAETPVKPVVYWNYGGLDCRRLYMLNAFLRSSS